MKTKTKKIATKRSRKLDKELATVQTDLLDNVTGGNDVAQPSLISW